jgi:hypothetical protein
MKRAGANKDHSVDWEKIEITIIIYEHWVWDVWQWVWKKEDKSTKISTTKWLSSSTAILRSMMSGVIEKSPTRSERSMKRSTGSFPRGSQKEKKLMLSTERISNRNKLVLPK